MQLRDLSIDDRRLVISMKADLSSEYYKEALLSNDINTNLKGLNNLLEVDPDFLLLDSSFLEAAYFISYVLNNKSFLLKLEELTYLEEKEKQRRRDAYFERERFYRGFPFDFDDYLEMLELDDYLLREKSYYSILDNPYLVYSIPYLKNIFSDYYDENKKADNYLYTILKRLSNTLTITDDLVAVNDILSLFDNDDKIITFSRRI